MTLWKLKVEKNIFDVEIDHVDIINIHLFGMTQQEGFGGGHLKLVFRKLTAKLK